LQVGLWLAVSAINVSAVCTVSTLDIAAVAVVSAVAVIAITLCGILKVRFAIESA
jgi:hypothetical protein